MNTILPAGLLEDIARKLGMQYRLYHDEEFLDIGTGKDHIGHVKYFENPAYDVAVGFLQYNLPPNLRNRIPDDIYLRTLDGVKDELAKLEGIEGIGSRILGRGATWNTRSVPAVTDVESIVALMRDTLQHAYRLVRSPEYLQAVRQIKEARAAIDTLAHHQPYKP